MACFCIFRGAVKLPPTLIWSLTVPVWSFLALVGVRSLAFWVCVTATFFAVSSTVRALLPSAPLIQAATAWIHGLRSRATTSPQGRGVLRRRLLRLHLPGAPLVVVLWRSALARTSTSSLRSSEHVRGFHRAGGGLSLTAVWLQLEKKLVVLLPQRSCRRNS